MCCWPSRHRLRSHPAHCQQLRCRDQRKHQSPHSTRSRRPQHRRDKPMSSAQTMPTHKQEPRLLTSKSFETNCSLSSPHLSEIYCPISQLHRSASPADAELLPASAEPVTSCSEPPARLEIQTPPPLVTQRVLVVKNTLKNPQTTVNGTFGQTWGKSSGPIVVSADSHCLESNRRIWAYASAQNSTCKPLTTQSDHLLYGWAPVPRSGRFRSLAHHAIGLGWQPI